MTKQALFIHLCKEKPELLDIQYQVGLAISKRILRRNRTDGFILFGNRVGKNKEQIIRYLSNPEHQDMLIRLEEALESEELDYEDTTNQTEVENADSSNETPVRDTEEDKQD